MLWSLQLGPSFDSSDQLVNRAVWSAPATAARSVAIALQAICEAWREGLAACREYEQLRSRGVDHDAALREALGMPSPPCAPAKALYFAGKA
jgi:hypothetical protein